MATMRIRAPCVPIGLHGSLLLDTSGRPRYWATVWAAVDGAALQDSTLVKHLRAIDLLYQSAELMPQFGNLDRLISTLDFDGIESCLTSFFVTQRNRRETSSEVWQRAISFVRQILLRLSGSTEIADARIGEIQTKLIRLDQLYLSLKMPRSKRPEPIRALPSIVIEDIYEVILPESPRNPFRTEALRWRNFVLILLLLHQGLRRSETLILPVDALKHEWSSIKQHPFCKFAILTLA